MATELARPTYGELVQEMESKDKRHKLFKRSVMEALEEAHHPARLASEDAVGGLSAWSTWKGIQAASNALQKARKGSSVWGTRIPDIYAGATALAVGLAGYTVNLAIDYDMPTSWVRDTARVYSGALALFGTDEVINATVDWWRKRKALKAAEQAAATAQTAPAPAPAQK